MGGKLVVAGSDRGESSVRLAALGRSSHGNALPRAPMRPPLPSRRRRCIPVSAGLRNVLGPWHRLSERSCARFGVDQPPLAIEGRRTPCPSGEVEAETKHNDDAHDNEYRDHAVIVPPAPIMPRRLG